MNFLKYGFFALVLVLVTNISHANETCFGGVGQRCGGLNADGARFSSCTPSPNLNVAGVCFVSNGSWTHDQCCAANPDGVFCGGKDTSNACRTEWNRALARFFLSYQWVRVVDYREVNNTGIVDRPKYCARRFARVHRSDALRCCNNNGATPAPFWERLARPNLAVCR